MILPAGRQPARVIDAEHRGIRTRFHPPRARRSVTREGIPAADCCYRPYRQAGSLGVDFRAGLLPVIPTRRNAEAPASRPTHASGVRDCERDRRDVIHR